MSFCPLAAGKIKEIIFDRALDPGTTRDAVGPGARPNPRIHQAFDPL